MYKLLPKIESKPEIDTLRSSDLDIPSEFVDEAIFAGGSFWDLEACLSGVDGVLRTATGYCGGCVVKPTQREVSMKITGHTEAVRVVYDSRIVSFRSLCDAFWGSHDPTNKEYLVIILIQPLIFIGPVYATQEFGIDTHLRSAIFCANEEQMKLTRESKVRQQMKLDRRIVTRILPRDSCFIFYLAETRHQKHYLQRDHTDLCESLALRSTQHFVDSHLACKLNGILGKCDRSAAAEDLKRVMGAHRLPEKTRLVLEQTVRELTSK
ncbi:hypothetical protein QJS04_geneDACA018704 [Acorus gramineus]|uniref:peptide-methionine (S)-S-oxide reductase n=1 Tax=Acorus gramineus TaxID=55184 RepID=A0AAV9A3U8_ACOGR|nr:hypothetical protein QJS04_geneDACA018704 [Acorus gramineus]